MLFAFQKQKKYLVMVIHNELLSFALYDTKKNNITLCDYQELTLPDGIFYHGMVYNTILLKQYIKDFVKNIPQTEGILYVCDVEMKKNRSLFYYGSCVQFLILSHACGLSFLTLLSLKKINHKKILNREHTPLQHLSLAAIEYVMKEL